MRRGNHETRSWDERLVNACSFASPTRKTHQSQRVRSQEAVRVPLSQGNILLPIPFRRPPRDNHERDRKEENDGEEEAQEEEEGDKDGHVGVEGADADPGGVARDPSAQFVEARRLHRRDLESSLREP